jgi:hypothetical protein
MIRLLIVSRPDEIGTVTKSPLIDGNALVLPDGNLSPVGLRQVHALQASMAAAKQSSYAAVVSCSKVEAFVAAVQQLGQQIGPIGLLDIVGHGAPGLQMIGDEVLFQADNSTITKGSDVPARLTPWLAPCARIRLLGCKTALGRPGRTLLAKLGLRFGADATVYGTIEAVAAEQFSNAGYSQTLDLLFSSEAAIDHEAPDAKQRTENLEALIEAAAPVAAAALRSRSRA